MTVNKPLTFEISLSVLDHLGRNLYRSFATVLGEAISNSWDANAKNVWIYIDREKGSFFIKDDGDGMTLDDFQRKFLTIGYSKRKLGETHSSIGRPYIGRKGIGKLALLSCAERIHTISKVIGGSHFGGVIDNTGLDRAITDDLKPQDYTLAGINMQAFNQHTKNHENGTIIYFENIKEGIKNSLEHLRKIIAMSFRFSLKDKSFHIFVEDKEVTLDDIADLTRNTQLLWNINNLDDPYVKETLHYKKENRKKEKENLQQQPKPITMNGNVKGFIASVFSPRHLKIIGTGEKIGVDLFVNGRLRERDILRHIPRASVVENYLYGQIHFDELDDGEDRFSTNREGIVANDAKFSLFLEDLKKVMVTILKDWDASRIELRDEGDPENESIPKKQRKAAELFNIVSGEYDISEDPKDPEKRERVNLWVTELVADARYNFPSYAECFISENLVRRHIQEKKIELSEEARKEISQKKKNADKFMDKANISIEIRKSPTDLSYLNMEYLATLVDKVDQSKAGLSRDATEYKPIRDALMHTALLTDEAKKKLTSVFENIRERVKNLLSKS